MVDSPCWMYISNNLYRFSVIAKEQHWSAKEALISVRDMFSISESKNGLKLMTGEINTMVCFNDNGELEILNVSIDRDTFKIFNTSPKILEVLKGYSNITPEVKTRSRRRKSVSIYYDMMMDITRSSNVSHYNLLLAELGVMLNNK